MASPIQKRGGVEVDGLAEAIRGLAKLDGQYRKDAVEVFRYEAKKVQGRSQKLVGTIGRYPNRAGMIGRSATSTGAGVRLKVSKYPWALGAEYGEDMANIPQRDGGTMAYPQAGFDRRTMGEWRPPTSSDMMKNRGGYMIQPTIRAALPGIAENVSFQLDMLIQNAMRRAGVKTLG